MRPISTLLSALVVACAGATAGCGGGSSTTVPMPADQAHASPGHGVGRAGGGAVGGDAGGERRPEDGPYVGELWLHPDPPMPGQDLRAEPRIDNPAGGFLDVDYQWYADGERLFGATGDTVSGEHLTRGTRLEVEVTATDVNGRKDSFRFGDIEVANGLPVITSRLGGSPDLNGFRFTGEDPDGDALTWRIEGAPPGVAIGRTSGVMGVDTSKVYASGVYEMQVVADDGHGGISKLTVRTTLGGAKAAKKGYREVADAAVVAADTLSDEEYQRAAAEMAARMDQMSEEEFDEYVDRSVEVEEEALEAAAASELPAGTGPHPYPQ